MKWEKLGRIFEVNGNFPWMNTHASFPYAVNIGNDVFRVYFSPRNSANQSSIAFFDLNIDNPTKPLNISDKPILCPGKLGLFDDAGVSLSSIIPHNDTEYLYYVGWHLAQSIPFHVYCGLAILDKKSNVYIRVKDTPILDRIDNEPYSVGFCDVMLFREGFKMWYECCEKHKKEGPVFSIKYAESKDGIHWERNGVTCIQLSPDEMIVAKPSVIFENNFYKMWYCHKKAHGYRIGYAESDNGIDWVRKDEEAGITTSESGWDSEQIEYPFVFDHKGERYMLYNGNGYGKTGIGLARLLED